MDVNKDYYATLGVLPSIDDVALKAACRALIKKYHPDLAAGHATDGRATDIIEAYRVLSDADQRRTYDRARKEINAVRVSMPDLRAMKMPRQPGPLRALLTSFLLGYGVRALVSACVLVFLLLGPIESHLVEALASLRSLDGLGVPGPNAVRHVEIRPTVAGERDNEVLVVRSEMRGTSKVIHVVKVDRVAGQRSYFGVLLYRHLFGQRGQYRSSRPLH